MLKQVDLTLALCHNLAGQPALSQGHSLKKDEDLANLRAKHQPPKSDSEVKVTSQKSDSEVKVTKKTAWPTW